VGLAVSDETELIATPLKIIQVQNRRQLLDELAQIVAAEEIGKIVLGLPLHLNGKEGQEAANARTLAAELTELLHLPVDFMDERLTSFEAERMLAEAGVKPQKRKAYLDSTAAAIILQTYLDSARSSRTRQNISTQN
jgi:putative Holliday junction resolvase